MISKLRQEADFFKKRAEYSYKRTQHIENASTNANALLTTSSPELLQGQLNDANELLEQQYRQVQVVTEDLHALQDAMRLKDMEIERL